ncbi:MAG: hypothetical protein ACXACD_10720, partial [Candidatus Thorarchaeota archaeon]
MTKIENPLFVSLYAQWVDKILGETSNIDEANQSLRDMGKEMGSSLYLTTELASKTKDTVMTREDVAKLIDNLYKLLFDRKPTDVDMKS